MEIKENVSLRAFNTFGVDQSARYFASLTDATELTELVQFKNDTKLPLLILGGGSNLLFSKNFAGIVAQLDLTGVEFIDNDSDHYLMQVAAGIGMP